jgi:hypothetical protein
MTLHRTILLAGTVIALPMISPAVAEQVCRVATPECIAAIVNHEHALADAQVQAHAAAAARRTSERAEAEAQAQVDAAAARAKEAAHKQAEAHAAQAEWLSHPGNALSVAYGQYRIVTHCHEAREGYAVVYINDVEMERAKAAVTSIEAAMLKADPSIDTAATWNKVVASGIPTLQSYQCQDFYHTLLQSAPTVPVTKDFGQHGG